MPAGLPSAAALAFEITLTRLFSVTQCITLPSWQSASPYWATAPAQRSAWRLVGRAAAGRRAAALAVLFSLGVWGLPQPELPAFDSYRIAWERVQVVYLWHTTWP